MDIEDRISDIEENSNVAQALARIPAVRRAFFEVDHACEHGAVCNAVCRTHADVGGEG